MKWLGASCFVLPVVRPCGSSCVPAVCQLLSLLQQPAQCWNVPIQALYSHSVTCSSCSLGQRSRRATWCEMFLYSLYRQWREEKLRSYGFWYFHLCWNYLENESRYRSHFPFSNRCHHRVVFCFVFSYSCCCCVSMKKLRSGKVFK